MRPIPNREMMPINRAELPLDKSPLEPTKSHGSAVWSKVELFFQKSLQFVYERIQITEAEFEDYKEQALSISSQYIPEVSLRSLLGHSLSDWIAVSAEEAVKLVDYGSQCASKTINTYTAATLTNIFSVHVTRYTLKKLAEVFFLQSAAARLLERGGSSKQDAEHLSKLFIGSIATGGAVLLLEKCGKIALPSLLPANAKSSKDHLNQILKAKNCSVEKKILDHVETASELVISSASAQMAANLTPFVSSSPYLGDFFTIGAAISSLSTSRFLARSQFFSRFAKNG